MTYCHLSSSGTDSSDLSTHTHTHTHTLKTVYWSQSLYVNRKLQRKVKQHWHGSTSESVCVCVCVCVLSVTHALDDDSARPEVTNTQRNEMNRWQMLNELFSSLSSTSEYRNTTGTLSESIWASVVVCSCRNISNMRHLLLWQPESDENIIKLLFLFYGNPLLPVQEKQRWKPHQTFTVD